MESLGGHHRRSTSSDIESSSSTTTTSTATITPNSSTRRYSVAGVIRSLFHAVLVQDTKHLNHVLTSLSVDPNKIRDKEQKTMLMIAATENKHRSLRYLLSLPLIQVDLQDDEGETALYQAAAAGSTECVQLLLHAGASASLGNEESITPLIIASYNGFVAICRLLISLGRADVNQQDNTKKSALLLASYAGHVDIMAELIEHGAMLNTLDQYGWSSLMLAAYAGEAEACKLLLEHGADPHIKTSNGKNARSLSWDAGHKAIAVYIAKYLSRSSAGGSGSGTGSRSVLQPVLPPAPRSPSRRTHSPAPSLPSVPEEASEEHLYKTRYSFPGHNSTISRHSAISTRFVSPPSTLRQPPTVPAPETQDNAADTAGRPAPTHTTALATMFNVQIQDIPEHLVSDDSSSAHPIDTTSSSSSSGASSSKKGPSQTDPSHPRPDEKPRPSLAVLVAKVFSLQTNYWAESGSNHSMQRRSSRRDRAGDQKKKARKEASVDPQSTPQEQGGSKAPRDTCWTLFSRVICCQGNDPWEAEENVMVEVDQARCRQPG